MLRLAPIFTDHMVLQREKPLRIWGTGEEGVSVTVTLGKLSGTALVRDGRWSLTLPSLPAGGPYILHITDGTQTVRLTDVMLGEVWLCGGQSNMELALKDSIDPQAALDACTQTDVRLYHVGKHGCFDQQFYDEENASHWQLPSVDACPHWTAIGYHFGVMLAGRLGVTVGLVECCCGGTSASAWISEEMLAGTAIGQQYLADYANGMEGRTDEEACRAYLDYCDEHARWQQRVAACYQKDPQVTWDKVLELCGKNHFPGPWAPNNPLRPHGLYDTMVRRITPYTLRGVLYYQGESDDHRPEGYQTLLGMLIRQWREDFRDDALPFLIVQLPMFCYEDTQGTNWAKLRMAQEKVYRTTKHTGLACILDCGEFGEIHPKEKRTPAVRLYLQALREVYHLQEQGTTAPLVREAVPAQGGVRVIFDHVDNGLILRGDTGFELRDAEGSWHAAKAVVNADTLLVTSREIAHPTGVRYAWINYGEVTLFEQNGIPAAPFFCEV